MVLRSRNGSGGPASALRDDGFAPRGGALGFPGFQWFIVAILCHSLGYWVADVGQRWLVQELTASPFYVGLIGFCGNIPMFLLSLPGGVLADRVDRLRLIAISRSFGGVMTLLLAGLIVADMAGVWHVALYALALGIMFSIEVPSRQALFPTLVARPYLMHAVAITSAVWSGSTVVGPAIAGLLIAHVGIPGCFFITAGLQVLAVISFLQLRPYLAARAEDEGREHPWAAFRAGVVYIREHEVILGLLVLGLLTVVLGQSASVALLPSFAAGVLSGGASTFSLLVVALGAGGLAANVALSVWHGVSRKGRWALWMALGLGVALVAFSQAGALPFAMGVLLAIGVLTSGVMTLIGTLIQAYVADEMRGRVMSAYTLCWGSTSFGSLAFGGIGEAMGVPFALAAGGVLTLVAVFAVVAAIPSIARLD